MPKTAQQIENLQYALKMWDATPPEKVTKGLRAYFCDSQSDHLVVTTRLLNALKAG